MTTIQHFVNNVAHKFIRILKNIYNNRIYIMPKHKLFLYIFLKFSYTILVMTQEKPYKLLLSIQCLKELIKNGLKKKR